MGVPISPVGGTRTHDPTPPRRGATHNSADFGDYSRTRPSARGKRNWRGVCKAITQPQTPPRRARWGNDQVGTNTGMLLARSPIGRGAAGLRSFFSVVVFRETKVGQSQRGKAPPNPTEKKLLTHHQIARNRKRSARLAAEGRKQFARTTLYPPPLTTAATQRRPYRGACRRANRSATLTAGLCEARAGWAGGEQYR